MRQTDRQTAGQTEANVSRLDAWIEGWKAAKQRKARVVPVSYAPSAARAWLQGYDDRTEEAPKSD